MSQAFSERLAWYRPELRQNLGKLRRPLWIHAVSVGEMMLASVLVRELRASQPELDIVLTTTTVTGRQIGEKLADDRVTVLYNPFDWFFCVRRAFQTIRPCLLLLMEQEIWPNYLWEATSRQVPVWLLNARLSDRSYARFRSCKRWLRPLLSKLSLVTAQDEEDVQRLADAGFPSQLIFNNGSMKFDVAELAFVDACLGEQIRHAAGWSPDQRVLLAGSTHAGEERVLLAVFAELKQQYPQLRLLLAPRHFERAEEVEELCRKFAVSVVRRSVLHFDRAPLEGVDVILLDTTGELRSLYELGEINFIGKSLCGKGGQNFIEAARAGKPVVVGPNMQNFARLAALFVREGALIQVRDAAELRTVIGELLANPQLARERGAAARRVYEANLGAGKRTAAMIRQFLEQSDHGRVKREA